MGLFFSNKGIFDPIPKMHMPIRRKMNPFIGNTVIDSIDFFLFDGKLIDRH